MLTTAPEPPLPQHPWKKNKEKEKCQSFFNADVSVRGAEASGFWGSIPKPTSLYNDFKLSLNTQNGLECPP